jgi:hypothetical protein
MNRDQILNMPAGRDLDALIATHVMGWKQDDSEQGAYFDFWITAQDDPDAKVQLNQFQFSTDINLAFPLVEKLGLVIGYDEDEGYPGENWLACLEWDPESAYAARGESAPLAICRTVLLIITDATE